MRKVYGVGRLDIIGQVAIKTVEQHGKGSAYMKIPGMIIAIHQAGFEKIILRVNHDHPYYLRIQDQLSLLEKIIPGIKLETF